uniref:Apple domain-containing protein n=1 Tax=Ascaris lumbricoides TaxID=6252 RepID=A0A0M3IVC1_ASCLU
MPMSHVDITNLESTQSRSVPLTHQPFVHEGTAVGCPGRLEFQRMSVTALPKLNVTNDVPARTPADCARKCFETEGCSLAGYIPSPTGDPTNGVCVLTSDDELCLDTKNFVPQHASLSPFVLSCIKCSPCKYTISTVTPERKLPQFEHSEQLLTIG